MDLDPQVRGIVRELAKHWCRNPLASDTPDGISRWWLSLSDVIPIEAIVRALAWMTDRGLIEEVRAADHRVRFRRIGGDVQFRLQRLAAGLDPDDGLSGTCH